MEYKTWYEPSETFKSKDRGSIVVDPRLYVPSSSAPASNDSQVILPLDGICILTVIPKWLPTLSRWPEFFRTFADSGYNMVHFAPVSSRGISNSPYSIYDQLSISSDLFEEKLTEEKKHQIINNMLRKIHSEYGILSITDVVWNHTACNSFWLQEHPEAGLKIPTESLFN